MKINFLPISAFLLLTVVLNLSQAALPSEEYWEAALPNTPMPKTLIELLHPDFEDDKSTAVNVGKGGVIVRTKKPGSGTNVNVGKGGVVVSTHKPGSGTGVNVGKGGVVVGTKKPGSGTNVNVGKGGVVVGTHKPGSGTGVHVGKGGVGVNTHKPGKGTSVNVGKGGVHVGTGKPGGGTGVNVGKGGVGVRTRHKGKPVYVSVHPGYNPFEYNYAASQDQLHDNPNVALFFLEKDLHTSASMNLQFTRTASEATFLPSKIAEAIPFSSEKFPQILNQFSISPKSEQAEAMKKTITECEAPANKGEEKYCAKSLESMVDFSTSKLGENTQALSTEVTDEDSQIQEYHIASVQKTGGANSVVCHSQTYAYAVFYCHATHTTRAYIATMVGADGKKVKATAVCHTDTSSWNPKHLAFQVLMVKPGTVPICHFLPEDHIVWVSK